MAKCERREIKPEPPPVEYVLTLTEDEAKWLIDAADYFAHACAGQIVGALRSAGVFGKR